MPLGRRKLPGSPPCAKMTRRFVFRGDVMRNLLAGIALGDKFDRQAYNDPVVPQSPLPIELLSQAVR